MDVTYNRLVKKSKPLKDMKIVWSGGFLGYRFDPSKGN